MATVTPFIWFKDNAEEAMNYYVSVFPNSKIVQIGRYEGEWGIPGEKELQGKVLTGVFEVMGTRFMCLDGGTQPGMELNSSAVSFLVEFDAQEDLDKVWDKLVEDGGKPQQCGWIVDKFGVTWQIVPAGLGRMMADPNTTAEQKKAVTVAMISMVKLDAFKLEAAYEKGK